jgi:hypothetical protein
LGRKWSEEIKEKGLRSQAVIATIKASGDGTFSFRGVPHPHLLGVYHRTLLIQQKLHPVIP